MRVQKYYIFLKQRLFFGKIFHFFFFLLKIKGKICNFASRKQPRP